MCWPYLVLEIELGVEAHGPLVEEGDVVSPLLGGEALDEALVDFGGAAQHVEVLGDEGLHARPLHLDRHHVAAVAQHRAVDLRERGRGDGLVGDRENALTTLGMANEPTKSAY